MPVERVATDVVSDDLIGRYRAGVRRLEVLVRDGLRRGLDAERIAVGDARVGDATQAYRERQLRAARAILAELEQGARQVAPGVVARAYRSAIVAVDALELDGSAALAGRFGGVHQATVERLAANLGRSLERSARLAGDSVDTVFARANELEGALPVSGVGSQGFIGRRTDDAWRRVALEKLAEGQVSLETRRQISTRLVAELVDQGVSDAVTGYVDRAGRRWSLDRYAEMATRTTTREATSRATCNRLIEGGRDLVTISSHDHIADECTPYDGQTFSLSGNDDSYPELDDLPPFHPNCAHVVTPADANLDRFEAALEAAVRGTLGA